MLVLISIIGLVSSTIYLVLVCVAARGFRKVAPNPNVDRTDLPLVTVLKPLHGLEPQLERNLESFFQQNYPRFELIFGARSASDPALQIVAALQRKYPQVNSSIVLSGEPAYPNAKVFSLEKMLARASSPYLVITDSDVCVNPNCLHDVIIPLLATENGVVTCLYLSLIHI